VSVYTADRFAADLKRHGVDAEVIEIFTDTTETCVVYDHNKVFCQSYFHLGGGHRKTEMSAVGDPRIGHGLQTESLGVVVQGLGLTWRGEALR